MRIDWQGASFRFFKGRFSTSRQQPRSDFLILGLVLCEESYDSNHLNILLYLFNIKYLNIKLKLN